MANAEDLPPDYSPPSSSTSGTPIILNLNHCTPGPANKRGKLTVGKLIESIPDVVVLPNTDSRKTMGRFLIQRAEKRHGVKLPVPETMAIALTQGNPQDGKRILIVDDESWQGARALLSQRGGDDEAFDEGKVRQKPRKGDVRMELWFVTETVEEWERRNHDEKKCAVM